MRATVNRAKIIRANIITMRHDLRIYTKRDKQIADAGSKRLSMFSFYDIIYVALFCARNTHGCRSEEYKMVAGPIKASRLCRGEKQFRTRTLKTRCCCCCVFDAKITRPMNSNEQDGKILARNVLLIDGTYDASSVFAA